MSDLERSGRNAISYRQVGKGCVGSIIKRAPLQLKAGISTVTSIPSKYPGSAKRYREAEQDAFGNRTHRFQIQTNDLPGPGAYHRKATLERDPEICGSVSRKGYGGGFASAAPRFRNAKEVNGALLPGPGTYS
ncbi:unnamed protein product, partial [Discosporangium mesarthrocarpum]